MFIPYLSLIKGFAHLVNTDATTEAFKARYNIPQVLHIEYCPEGDIEDERLPRVLFIPLMVVLEGGLRFPLDSLLLGTFRFYGLSLDQCLPNFYRVVSCVGQLNRLFNPKLTHHDINFLYNCYGSLTNSYYLKVRDP